VLVFSSLFIVQFCLFVCLFLRGAGQFAQWAMLVYPRGGWGITMWCSVLTCWSGKCLPNRFGTAVWWRWKPSCFLSVTWCGEAFQGLGVQSVEVLILLAALFLPSVAPACQQGFGVMELTRSVSAP
jgi:hypothetical protein